MLLHSVAAGLMDNSGAILANGILYVYLHGTTTLATLYSEDATDSDTLANPLTLDASGKADVYVFANVDVSVETSAGVALGVIESVSVDLRSDQIATTPDDGTSAGTDGDVFDQANLSALLAAWLASGGGRNWYYKTAATGGVARTIRDKLSLIYDVRDFGALGNDSTVDGAAFTAALTACPTAGGAIYVPRGKYPFSSAFTVAARTNVTIFGDGAASVLRQSDDGAYSLIDLTGACTGITIENLSLYGGGNGSSTVAKGIVAGSATVDIKVDNVRFKGNASRGFNTALDFEGTDSVVSRCDFRQVYGVAATGVGGTAILLNGARCKAVGNSVVGTSATINYGVYCGASAVDCDVSGNDVLTAQTAGFYATGSDACTFRGNTARGTAGGAATNAQCGFAFYNCTDLVVEANRARSSTLHGFSFVDVCSASEIVGNSSQLNTGHGFDWHLTAATAVSDCHVVGNLARLNGKAGFYIQGADDFSFTGNKAQKNSTSATRTYPGFELTTYYAAAAHTGGARNTFQGNSCRESSDATYEHVAALRIRSGNSDGIDGNVLTTVIGENDFPPQNATGTPAIIIIGSTAGSLIQANSGNGRERQLSVAASVTLYMPSNGAHVFVDTNGGDRTVTLPVPTTNGVRFRITKSLVATNTNALIIVSPAAPLIVHGPTAATLVQTLTSAQTGEGSAGTTIELESQGAYWYAVAAKPVYAQQRFAGT